MKIQVDLATDEEMKKYSRIQKMRLLKGDIEEIDEAILALQRAKRDRMSRSMMISEGI